MEIGFIGGDRRQEVAAAFLREAGHTTHIVSDGESLGSYSFLVLPYPVTRDGVHVAGTKRPLSTLTHLPALPLFGGRVPAVLRQGRWVYDVEEDEALLRENAYLTAAAGVATALKASERAFFRFRAAVIGYGRIGKETAGMLRALGAQTSIYVRREAARQEALAAGFFARLLSEVAALDEGVVFGTVPSPAENLASLRVRDDAMVYDLGGGLPPALATVGEGSVTVLSLRGAPALFAPQAAKRRQRMR